MFKQNVVSCFFRPVGFVDLVGYVAFLPPSFAIILSSSGFFIALLASASVSRLDGHGSLDTCDVMGGSTHTQPQIGTYTHIMVYCIQY